MKTDLVLPAVLFPAVLLAACTVIACTVPPEPAEEAPLAAFVDVTASSGVAFVHANGSVHANGAVGRHLPATFGPGVTLFDADGDGDLDLYLVQGGPLPGAPDAETDRRAPSANRLYLNRGDLTFEDVTEGSGTGDTGYGMGAAVGDFNGDGALDLYVLNLDTNVLYKNLGDATFEPVHVGADDAGWSIGAVFYDADADGDVDLYVVNHADEPDRLYRNDGGHFFETELGADPDADGLRRPPLPSLRSAAAGDLDGDGDSDLVVATNGGPIRIWRNDSGRP